MISVIFKLLIFISAIVFVISHEELNEEDNVGQVSDARNVRDVGSSKYEENSFGNSKLVSGEKVEIGQPLFIGDKMGQPIKYDHFYTMPVAPLEKKPPSINIPLEAPEDNRESSNGRLPVTHTYERNSKVENETPHFNIPLEAPEESKSRSGDETATQIQERSHHKAETEEGPGMHTYVQHFKKENEPSNFNVPLEAREESRSGEEPAIRTYFRNFNVENEPPLKADEKNFESTERVQNSEIETETNHNFSSAQSESGPNQVEQNIDSSGIDGVGSSYKIKKTEFDSKISSENRQIGSINVKEFQKVGSVFPGSPEFQNLLPKFKLYKKKLKVLISRMIPNCPDVHSKKILKTWARLFKNAFPNYDKMTNLSLKYAKELKQMLNLCLEKIVRNKFKGVKLQRSDGESKWTEKASFESETAKVVKRQVSKEEFIESFTSDVVNPLANYFAKMPEMVQGAYEVENVRRK